MSKIKETIEAVMASEEHSSLFSFGSVLFLLSHLYGRAVRLRESFYKRGILKSEKLPCKVISVGNLTAGGTGKTPMTIYTAERIARFGYKVAVVSRGYRGRAEKTGGIVSDGQRLLMGPDSAGDEPFMMAETLKRIPVIVGQNRFEAGMVAVRHFKPDVIVLDDAFQHLKLMRDINLVLLDSRRPFGNTHLLPRGPLREPLSALSRGDAFILTRSDPAAPETSSPSCASLPGPVFQSFHIPYICKVIKGEASGSRIFSNKPDTVPYDAGVLKGQKVFAFSGIAGNRDFRCTVENMGCEIAGFYEFSDHYQYSDEDIHAISDSAKKVNADILTTTEKDYARIAHQTVWPADLVVMGIRTSFGDGEDAFTRFIKKRLDDKD